MHSQFKSFLAAVCGCLILCPATTAFAEWISLDNFKSQGPLQATRAPGPNRIEKENLSRLATRIQVQLDALNVTAARDPRASQPFVTVGLTGADSFTTEIGRPRLPTITRWVEYSGDLSALSAQLSAASSQEFDLSDLGRSRLMPAQPPLPKTPGALARTPFAFDAKLYTQDSWYPARDFAIRQTVRVRGHRLALVEFYPVRYNPFRNSLSVRRKAGLTLATSTGAKSERSEVFQSFLARNVINFESAKSSTAMGARDSLLIVAGKAFRDSAPLRDYTELKRRMGLQVILKFTDELPSATDAQLRASIQDLYARTTPRLAYVVLVGDVEHIPTHSGNAGGEQATDHYFAAIDKPTYEEDLGGTDLFISRIPVKTSTELATVLGKLTKYQTASFSDTAWTRNLSWVATDDRWETAEGTHNYVADTYTRALGYSGNFPTAGESGGDKLYAITHRASTANLVEMFKQGRSFITYSGHGSHTGWEGPEFHRADIDQLNHGDALPFVTGYACITNTFTEETDSFGEDWIKAPQGAVAYLGTTNSSYWDEDDVMERAFFDTIFRDRITSAGAVVASAQAAVWRAYGGENRAPYYAEIYNLNGDASTELLLEAPQSLDVTFDPTFPVQRESFSAQVARQGQPLPNAYVSLLRDGQIVAGGFTAADGTVEIPVEPGQLTPGERLQVSVMAKSSRPSLQDLEVISAGNTPFLSLSRFEVDGGGLAAAGKNVALRLTLTNRGQAPSGSLRLNVTSELPAVTVTQNSLTLPPLAPGASAQAEGVLEVALARLVSDGSMARLTIQWEDSASGTSGNTRLLLPLAAPVLTLASSATTERAGNGDGFVSSGEEGEFQVALTNTGHATLPAEGAMVTLFSYTDGVAVEGPVSLTGDIAAGARAQVTLPFRVGTITPGTMGRFVARISWGDFVADFPLYATFGIPVTELVRTSTTLPLSIPDANSEGVAATADYTQQTALQGISVYVKIRHSYIGDLLLKLESPTGRSLTLQNRAGGGQDDMECWYVTAGNNHLPVCTPVDDLNSVLADPPQGRWTLKVVDDASSDTGELTDFQMEFRSFR